MAHSQAVGTKAAEALRLGDQEMLKQFGVVDGVIEEPMGGAQNDPQEAAKSVEKAIKSKLKGLLKLSKDELVENRYTRFRAIGEVDDGKVIDLSEAAS